MYVYLIITYTLYERMILNRIAPVVEQRLIKEQAGFRTGKSCTSQLLNLTQHIKDGYQRGIITGSAFVDLSAAYDTVNHRILIQKLYNITKDSPLCRVIQNMLTTSISTTEHVASYTQTIYVSQPSNPLL